MRAISRWPAASALSSAPSTGEARRILAGVLPNVYRAFEFREESDAYDRLAVSVTGDTLSEIYLEHRRSLEMEERGGARARVETVEVPSGLPPGSLEGLQAQVVVSQGGGGDRCRCPDLEAAEHADSRQQNGKVECSVVTVGHGKRIRESC